jgi:hypothetical protein
MSIHINLQGLLQSTCATLGFEVGEVWFVRPGPGKYLICSIIPFLYLSTDRSSYLLRFHQLYINSIYEEIQRVLIRPNIGDGFYNDESSHKLSPIVSSFHLYSIVSR